MTISDTKKFLGLLIFDGQIQKLHVKNTLVEASIFPKIFNRIKLMQILNLISIFTIIHKMYWVETDFIKLDLLSDNLT